MPPSARGARASRPGSCRCPAGSGSTPRTRPIATRSCRRPSEAGQRRGRRLARLGALGRRRGRDHRARPFRRVGAGRHDLRALRVHRRPRHRRRPARRPRGPPRPDPDARGRPRGHHPDIQPVIRASRGLRFGPRPLLTSSWRARRGYCTDDAHRVRCRSCRGRAEGRAHRRLGEAGLGHELIDLGGDGSDPADDYPDFAQRLGDAIVAGEADRGILICGSGVGASVAANKIRGIRAAICHDTYSAHQGVEHDDMNVLTLGSRVIGLEPAVRMRGRVPRCYVQRRATSPAAPREGPGDRGERRVSRLSVATGLIHVRGIKDF